LITFKKKEMLLKYKSNILVFLLAVSLAGCRKLVTVSPPTTSVSNENVYNSDATAIAVLTTIYGNMSSANWPGGITSMSFYTGLTGDELTLFNGAGNPIYAAYYSNSLSSQVGVEMWNNIYPIIYVANAAIEGLGASNSLTPAIKQQLMGEAEFVRAFCYFYLVNLYGDVPLVVGTNYSINAAMTRVPAAQVYAQIVSDLTAAEAALSTNYLDGTLLNTTADKVRPTKWAAAALLARIYLYTGDWADAETQASILLDPSVGFSLSLLGNVFLANSSEAIWQLEPIIAGQNTSDAITYIIPSSGLSSFNPVYLSQDLLNSFDPADMRLTNYIDTITLNDVVYSFAYKYKVNVLNAPVTEYEMVLRLAEQFLIRAEARAQQGNIAGSQGALSDLDAIRERAGLPDYNGPTDQASVIAAISHERENELFVEWGDRWFNLKRTSTLDAVMDTVAPSKGEGTWQPYKALYPVPAYELQYDPNLVQNTGY
jgi:starch-binding outer membrane protein, SusD/RagB family